MSLKDSIIEALKSENLKSKSRVDFFVEKIIELDISRNNLDQYIKGALPGIFEGRGGLYELGRKSSTVLRDEITCKYNSALFSKITISIKCK